MPDEYESKTIQVYGDKYAKARKGIPAYERVIHTRAVTITCSKCGEQGTKQAWPGLKPRYCSDACSKEARRDRHARE